MHTQADCVVTFALWPELLDGCGDAGYQSAATGGHQNGVQLRHLATDGSPGVSQRLEATRTESSSGTWRQTVALG